MVTATLHQTKVLYKEHFGPLPDDLPFQTALQRLVDELGMTKVQELVARTPRGIVAGVELKADQEVCDDPSIT